MKITPLEERVQHIITLSILGFIGWGAVSLNTLLGNVAAMGVEVINIKSELMSIKTIQDRDIRELRSRILKLEQGARL